MKGLCPMPTCPSIPVSQEMNVLLRLEKVHFFLLYRLFHKESDELVITTPHTGEQRGDVKQHSGLGYTAATVDTVSAAPDPNDCHQNAETEGKSSRQLPRPRAKPKPHPSWRQLALLHMFRLSLEMCSVHTVFSSFPKIQCKTGKWRRRYRQVLCWVASSQSLWSGPWNC